VELVRDAVWRLANDHLAKYEFVHPSAVTWPVNIERIVETSAWKNHNFDFTAFLCETDDRVRKSTNAYGGHFCHREQAHRKVRPHNPQNQIRQLCATSLPKGSIIRHLELTLILALR
jgi:hypothetical protein